MRFNKVLSVYPPARRVASVVHRLGPKLIVLAFHDASHQGCAILASQAQSPLDDSVVLECVRDCEGSLNPSHIIGLNDPIFDTSGTETRDNDVECISHCCHRLAFAYEAMNHVEAGDVISIEHRQPAPCGRSREGGS